VTVTSEAIAIVKPALAGARPENVAAVTAPPSFDDVYAAHYADLTVQLYAYFGDRQEAQDVVQEAFCRALARWRTVSEYDDPVAWVRRVAWNLAVSRWRRARTALNFVRRQRLDEPQMEGPNPERVALVAALSTLPPTQRRAVVLHYLADLPVAEIARREGVAEGTVKSWLHRGRAALADQLNPEPTAPNEGERRD
jgi:RNA polymerase sigma-70 factor (ECF subfamily)